MLVWRCEGGVKSCSNDTYMDSMHVSQIFLELCNKGLPSSKGSILFEARRFLQVLLVAGSMGSASLKSIARFL